MRRLSRDDLKLRNAMLPKLWHFCKAVSEKFQASPLLVLIIVLGLCAGITQKGFCVEITNGKSNANMVNNLSLILIGIANPSERKTPIYSYIKGVIDKVISRYNNTLQDEIRNDSLERQIAEEQFKSLRKKVSRHNTTDSQRQLYTERMLKEMKRLERAKILPVSPFVQDVTAPALVIALAENEAITIADPEGVIVSNLICDAGLPKIISSAFSGELIKTNRAATHSSEVKNPKLSLCMTTQPDNFKRLAKRPDLRTTGFIDRALIFYIESLRRRESIGPDVPDHLQRWFVGKIQEIVITSYTAKTPHTLRFSKEASEAWEQCHQEFEKSTRIYRDKLTGWYGKMKNVIGSIAAIYHLLECDAPLDEDIPAERVWEAFELVLIAEKTMLKVNDLFFPDKVTDCVTKILNWLDRERNTYNNFSLREASKAVDLKTDIVSQACNQLVNDGVLNVDFERVREAGRIHSHYYRINHRALHDYC